MSVSLFILTGPPAAGKTTLSHVVRETIQRSMSRPTFYLSTEFVLRIQADAVLASDFDPPIRFIGSQLVIEDVARTRMTDAAVRGVASLAKSLLRDCPFICIVAELPEVGLPTLFDALQEDETDGETNLLLIWLDAPFACRLERNESRSLELKLPVEAMHDFEERRATLVRDVYAGMSRRALFVTTTSDVQTVSKVIAMELQSAIRELS